MRVGGLGEVVVRVHAGLLRLQDVVVGSSEGEDGGSSDAEVRRRGECDLHYPLMRRWAIDIFGFGW